MTARLAAPRWPVVPLPSRRARARCAPTARPSAPRLLHPLEIDVAATCTPTAWPSPCVRALAALACAALPAAARGAPTRPPPGALYHERPVRAATCSDGTLVPARRSRATAASQARLAAHARAGRMAADDRARRRQRGRHVRRAATWAASGGTARTSSRPAGGRHELGAALRVRELPRDRVAERPPDRAATPAATCPSSCEAADCAAPARTGSWCASTAAASELDVPAARRAARTAATSAAGGTTPASCARSTCAGSTRSTSSNVHVRPRLPCPTCAATVYVRAVVANLRAASRRTPGSTGTVGGQHDRASRRATISGRGFHLFRGSATIENPQPVEPGGPAPLQGRRCGSTRRRGVVQRYTQHTGIRSLEVDDRRPAAAERQAPGAARRQHARGGPDARRRAAARRRSARNFDAAARPGRQHDALALPPPPARARAGRPLRDPRLVGGPRLPDARRAVPARRACAGAGAARWCATMVNRDRSHPSVIVWSLGNENTSKPGRGFTRYVRAGGAARRAGSTRRGSWASRSRAIRRSASRSCTRASTRSA